MSKQPGCREQHEYPQNLAALTEIIEQQRQQRLHTYLAFIDIAKAFDSVPFCAFLFKLYAQGCREQALWLIRELYRDAGSKIRKGGVSSEFIHLQKSVRQGCPGSTPIFILFMNDVNTLLNKLDEEQTAGVIVKGLSNLMRALLFADDVILIAPTVYGLALSIANFGKWCVLNELQVGLSKCAAMGISGIENLDHAHALLKSHAHSLIIGVDSSEALMLIPIRDEYKYLGTIIHFSYSLQHMLLKQANIKTCPSLFGIAPVLRNQCIPIKFRSQMLLQFLRPSLTHASVVWSMRSPSSTPPLDICTQKFLTLGVCFILGKTIKFKTDSALHEHNTALLELDILSVEAYATQEKIRFMTKYYVNPLVSTRSTYGLMINASKSTPTPGTISHDYLTEMEASYPELVALSSNHSTPLRKSDIKFYTTLAFCTKILLQSKHTETMKRYLLHGYYETRNYLLHAQKFFPLEEATTSLANLRIGASYPLTTLASKSKIPYKYRIYCYFCSGNVASNGTIDGHTVDNNYHELFECSYFTPQRTLIDHILSEIIETTPHPPPRATPLTPTPKTAPPITHRIPMLLGRPDLSNDEHTDSYFLQDWTPSIWPENRHHYRSKAIIAPPYILIARFLHHVHMSRTTAYNTLKRLQQQNKNRQSEADYSLTPSAVAYKMGDIMVVQATTATLHTNNLHKIHRVGKIIYAPDHPIFPYKIQCLDGTVLNVKEPYITPLLDPTAKAHFEHGTHVEYTPLNLHD